MSNHSYPPYSEEDWHRLNVTAYLTNIRPIDEPPWLLQEPNYYSASGAGAADVSSTYRTADQPKARSWSSSAPRSGYVHSSPRSHSHRRRVDDPPLPLPRRIPSREPEDWDDYDIPRHTSSGSFRQTYGTADPDWRSTSFRTVSGRHYARDGPSADPGPSKRSHTDSSTGRGKFDGLPHATYRIGQDGKPVQRVEHMTPTFKRTNSPAEFHRDGRLLPEGTYKKRYF